MGHRLTGWRWIILLGWLWMLSGCDSQAPPTVGPQYSTSANGDVIKLYRLAIHPLHNPEKLALTYQPLIDDLNRNIEGARFELEASRDYQRYEVKFRARAPEFLLPNPWQTLEAMKLGYRVIAMAGDATDFKGIFIVRKDSGITQIPDLKGKVVSYPSPTALAACIMPQYYLHTQGLDVNRDIENHYVGSQESSIMNVFLKQSAVGATWPPPWRQFQKDYPRKAEQLKLLWETPSLMNNSVMVRDDVPVEISEAVRQRLIALGKSEAGRMILTNMETARFHPADNNSYQPVEEFIRLFESEVRPVEQTKE